MRMSKIFISMPMKGKTRAEIITEQGKVLAHVNEKLGEPVMLVENYIDENISPLECLGENLKRLAHADWIVFTESWENCKRCVIEHLCAEKYNVPILELSE